MQYYICPKHHFIIHNLDEGWLQHPCTCEREVYNAEEDVWKLIVEASSKIERKETPRLKLSFIIPMFLCGDVYVYDVVTFEGLELSIYMFTHTKLFDCSGKQNQQIEKFESVVDIIELLNGLGFMQFM